jgi:hypothetical protein
MENLPPYIHYLLSTDDYLHPVGKIKLIQTHISYVVLAGDYVYKWKKPVDLGFLNFSTLEKRKFYCEQELVLNRRLCPDLYLDLVTVNLTGGRYSLGGTGQAVEYGVKMARMPENKMMTEVIGAGSLTKKHLDGIIKVLVPFYQAAEGGGYIDEFGRAEAVGKNVLENLTQSEGVIGQGKLSLKAFAKIKEYSVNVLSDCNRFDRRIAEGRIRDCHGDLYSANICLADKIYIFDCIEFNERFRYSDVAADIAFLAMDLDFYGLWDLSAYFIHRFIDESGDEQIMDVLNFYKCYRAVVRGKIGLFTAQDPFVASETARTCLKQAEKYFKLAETYSKG